MPRFMALVLVILLLGGCSVFLKGMADEMNNAQVVDPRTLPGYRPPQELCHIESSMIQPGNRIMSCLVCTDPASGFVQRNCNTN
jgi:hypothetical protein